jgi:hypothetical protein
LDTTQEGRLHGIAGKRGRHPPCPVAKANAVPPDIPRRKGPHLVQTTPIDFEDPNTDDKFEEGAENLEGVGTRDVYTY